jgi:hypothetical protein
MKTLCKKIILACVIALLSSSISQRAFCANSLTADVKAFADPYIVKNPNPYMFGKAFNLTEWVGYSEEHGLTPITSSEITFPKHSDLAIYYLGSYDEKIPLGDRDYNKTKPQYLVTNRSSKRIEAKEHLFSHEDISLGRHDSITFRVADKIENPFLSETTIIPSRDTALWPNGQDFYEFFSLNNVPGWTGGNGYYLGAFACAISDSNNVPVAPGWAEVADNGIYEEFVFLIGPACPPTNVPEPSVYIMLGTLLAMVALAISRRKQQV